MSRSVDALHERSALRLVPWGAGALFVIGLFEVAHNMAEHGGHLTLLEYFKPIPHDGPAQFNAPDQSFDLSDITPFNLELTHIEDRMHEVDTLVAQLQQCHVDFSQNPHFAALLEAQKNLHYIDEHLKALKPEIDELNNMPVTDARHDALEAKVHHDLLAIRSVGGSLTLTDEVTVADAQYLEGTKLLNGAAPGEAYDHGKWFRISDSPYINSDGHPVDFPVGMGNRLVQYAQHVHGVRLTDGFPPIGPHVIKMVNGKPVEMSLHYSGNAVDLVPADGLKTPSDIARDILAAPRDGFEAYYEDKPENLTPKFREQIIQALMKQDPNMSYAEAARHIWTGGTGPHLHLQFRGDAVHVLAGA